MFSNICVLVQGGSGGRQKALFYVIFYFDSKCWCLIVFSGIRTFLKAKELHVSCVEEETFFFLFRDLDKVLVGGLCILENLCWMVEGKIVNIFLEKKFKHWYKQVLKYCSYKYSNTSEHSKSCKSHCCLWLHM